MDIHLSNLNPTQLRNLHIEESRRFNDAINLGASITELEGILTHIKELETYLQNIESVEIPRIRIEPNSPNDIAQRNIA